MPAAAAERVTQQPPAHAPFDGQARLRTSSCPKGLRRAALEGRLPTTVFENHLSQRSCAHPVGPAAAGAPRSIPPAACGRRGNPGPSVSARNRNPKHTTARLKRGRMLREGGISTHVSMLLRSRHGPSSGIMVVQARNSCRSVALRPSQADDRSSSGGSSTSCSAAVLHCVHRPADDRSSSGGSATSCSASVLHCVHRLQMIGLAQGAVQQAVLRPSRV